MIGIGVTGSIAAYKSCYIVSQLVKEGYDVTVIMTENARRFISPLTFQSLTGNLVLHEMFGNDIQAYKFPHINIAEKLKVLAVVPATANIISKFACGLCDDILSCLAISSDCPKILAPAMNTKMYSNPINLENIEKLKSFGYKIIGPVKGRLACGYEGMGHLASEKDILETIKKHIK